jgi:hypothetical protein
MMLTEPQSAHILLTGAPNAFDRGGFTLRVTSAAAWLEVAVASDGSFGASLPGSRTDIIYLEEVTTARERFLGAVTGSTGSSVVVADPGPDRDMDGHPDAIDCAPDDQMRVGRSCTAGADGGTTDAGGCEPETCNGVDDDCDGMVDEDCMACAADSDCAASNLCVAGICVPCAMCGGACVDLTSDPVHCGACSAACAAGESCVGGVCTP